MRIAIVVHRAGEEFSGGAEEYALNLAKILSEKHSIDILTTTAKSHETWDNEFQAGDYKINSNLTIRRFKIDIGRSLYWGQLNKIVEDTVRNQVEFEGKTIVAAARQLPLGFLEEWLKFQGPFSKGLLENIARNEDQYDRIIFFTYLYAPTYWGIDLVSDLKKVLFIPTFHEEIPAYFSIFHKYKAFRHLFLTTKERTAAEDVIYGESVNGDILGYGIIDKNSENKLAAMPKSSPSYVLYAGRLESAKGVKSLFRFFMKYHRHNPKLKLYTIGNGPLKDFTHPAIEYKGFVSEEEKLRLMKNAIALVHPSRHESLSIVLIEAFMMGTPGLVNKQCAVLNDHIYRSGAGFSYDNYKEFKRALDIIYNDTGDIRDKLSQKARDYYLKEYSFSIYRDRIFDLITEGK